MSAWRWLTAGESHGPMLVAVLEGLPAGLALDEETLARDLARRRMGYGRGGRMKIESDEPRIVAGVRHGRTLGSPLAVLVENRDHANWRTRMKVGALAPGEDGGAPVTLPRPGHADLAGGIKYGHADLRNVLERASARETAARVALGAAARTLLRALDIAIGSAVVSVHEAHGRPSLDVLPEAAHDAWLLSARADESEVRAVDAEAAPRMVAAIEQAQRRRDTVGGVFEVLATGVPPGVGTYAERDQSLAARLVAALTTIPAVKAAEVGDGWQAAARFGTEVHDPIARSGPALLRSSNHAGGIEGGISNGQPILVRAAMKPIATVSNALPSVDLATGEPGRAHVERSDTCAVPAAAVVGEAVVALCLAEALMQTFGADTLRDLRRRVKAAWRRARRLPGHVFLAGLSGSGKTTAGPLLAQARGLPFVDLDAEVERDAGRPVREIFARDGEAGFRRMELVALRRVAAGAPAVVALGGGAVVQPAARDVLRRSGDTLWLHAPVGVLASRLGSLRDRPLLGDEPAAALARLERERADACDLAADARVDAAGTPADTAQRALGALEALSPEGRT